MVIVGVSQRPVASMDGGPVWPVAPARARF